MNIKHVGFFLVYVLATLSACSTLPQGEVADLKAEIGKLAEVVAKIEERTRPPKQLPKSASIPFGDNPILGEQTAKVGMVEFSDYQCPYCQTFHASVLPELKKNYIDTGKMLFVSRDTPMEFHPMAEPAAIAANCAGQQAAYFPMQDDLYAQQNRFGSELYKELARKHNLDMARFEQCLSDPQQQQEVRRDLAYATELGVQGTPTFYVGRVQGDRLVDAVPMVGAQPYEVFVQWLERYLNEKTALAQ